VLCSKQCWLGTLTGLVDLSNPTACCWLETPDASAHAASSTSTLGSDTRAHTAHMLYNMAHLCRYPLNDRVPPQDQIMAATLLAIHPVIFRTPPW
jgi:hypothetical protein